MWAIQSFCLTVDVQLSVFIIDAVFGVRVFYAAVACLKCSTHCHRARHYERARSEQKISFFSVPYDHLTINYSSGRIDRRSFTLNRNAVNRLFNARKLKCFVCFCFCASGGKHVWYGEREAYYWKLLPAEMVRYCWRACCSHDSFSKNDIKHLLSYMFMF